MKRLITLNLVEESNFIKNLNKIGYAKIPQNKQNSKKKIRISDIIKRDLELLKK